MKNTAIPERLGRYPASSFYYHHARLIEILHCIHAIAAPSGSGILDDRVRAVAGPTDPRGRRV